MDRENKSDLYKLGSNELLDKEYARYKRMRLWCGQALAEVLSEEDVDILVKLQRKELYTPQKLTTRDVSTLVVGIASFIILVVTNITQRKLRFKFIFENLISRKGCP